jgi:hypothetical protein
LNIKKIQISKSYLLLIASLFYCFESYAQRFNKEDTVLVFQISLITRTGSINQYRPYKKNNEIYWVDKQNVSHKSVINSINSQFLILGSDTVYPSEIQGVSMSSPFGFMPSQSQTTSPVIPDSSGKFNMMTYYDFMILAKTMSVSFAQSHNDPFFKNVSSEKYAADLERKRQRRIKMFAELDTCPLHFGIKTNLVRDLINEINISIELPIKRSFCVDVGAGVLYTKPDAGQHDFASMISDVTRMRGRNLSYFDHSYLIRHGFSLEVIPKFFLSKKKHLYLGPQLCFRYYYYNDKWIFVDADGSDDYRREFDAIQCEKSGAVQLNAIFGVQTPQIKRFLFDAFISIGIMYRGGIVTRSIDETWYSEGSHIDYYDPPREIKGGGISVSGQIGFRLGWRFGKAKLYK